MGSKTKSQKFLSLWNYLPEIIRTQERTKSCNNNNLSAINTLQMYSNYRQEFFIKIAMCPRTGVASLLGVNFVWYFRRMLRRRGRLLRSNSCRDACIVATRRYRSVADTPAKQHCNLHAGVARSQNRLVAQPKYPETILWPRWASTIFAPPPLLDHKILADMPGVPLAACIFISRPKFFSKNYTNVTQWVISWMLCTNV